MLELDSGVKYSYPGDHLNFLGRLLLCSESVYVVMHGPKVLKPYFPLVSTKPKLVVEIRYPIVVLLTLRRVVVQTIKLELLYPIPLGLPLVLAEMGESSFWALDLVSG